MSSKNHVRKVKQQGLTTKDGKDIETFQCALCKAIYDNEAEVMEHFKKEHALKKICEIEAADIGKTVLVHAQVQSIEKLKVFPVTAMLQCPYCEQKAIVPLDTKPDWFAKLLYGKVESLIPPNEFECRNSECKRGRMKVAGYEFQNLYALEVVDPLNIYAAGRDESLDIIVKDRHPFTLYLLCEELKDVPIGVIECAVKVLAVGGSAAKEIILLTDDFKQEEDYFVNYQPTEEELKEFEKQFGAHTPEECDKLVKKIDKTIAPHIVGREVPKFLNALTQHSPLYVTKRKIGTMRVLEAGDAGTAKSEILSDMVRYLSPTGSEYVPAETASRTGVAYSIPKDADGKDFHIRWGILPQCDGMFCGLDGLQKWAEEMIGEMRETFYQGILKVRRAASGERYARVRLIGNLNLPKQLKLYPLPWLALSDTNVFKEEADRQRWDFVYLFGKEDVDEEEITEAQNKDVKGVVKRAIPEEVWINHVKLAWSLKPEDVRLTPELYDQIQADVRYFQRKYNTGAVKPLHSRFYEAYLKAAVSFLVMSHNLPATSNKFHSYGTFHQKTYTPPKEAGGGGVYNSGQKVTELRNSLLGWFRNWMETYFETNLKLGELGAFQADVDVKLGEVTEYLLSNQNALKVLGAVIFKQGDLQQVDISKITGIEKSHVSELCAELAARGLLDKKKMDATDLAMEFYNRHKELFKDLQKAALPAQNKLEINEVTP